MFTNLTNTKVSSVLVIVFFITGACMFLPAPWIAQFLNFVALFIPISVFVMFIMNNIGK